MTTGNGADTPVGHGRWSYRRLNLVSFNIETLSAAAGTPENNIASLRDGRIADTDTDRPDDFSASQKSPSEIKVPAVKITEVKRSEGGRNSGNAQIKLIID